MLELLTLLAVLTAETAPPSPNPDPVVICSEIKEELNSAVEHGYVTRFEADDIYQDCLAADYSQWNA